MDCKALAEAGINVEEGIKRFCGNADIYERLLYKFPNERQFFDLIDAIEEGNVKEAFQAAHALKGVCGNLSIQKMYEDLVPIVEILRAGSMDGVEELCGILKVSYSEVIKVLQR